MTSLKIEYSPVWWAVSLVLIEAEWKTANEVLAGFWKKGLVSYCDWRDLHLANSQIPPKKWKKAQAESKNSTGLTSAEKHRKTGRNEGTAWNTMNWQRQRGRCRLENTTRVYKTQVKRLRVIIKGPTKHKAGRVMWDRIHKGRVQNKAGNGQEGMTWVVNTGK